MCTKGSQKISGLFALSQKQLNFSKILFHSIYIPLPSSWEVLYSLCKQRRRRTAELQIHS